MYGATVPCLFLALFFLSMSLRLRIMSDPLTIDATLPAKFTPRAKGKREKIRGKKILEQSSPTKIQNEFRFSAFSLHKISFLKSWKSRIFISSVGSLRFSKSEFRKTEEKEGRIIWERDFRRVWIGASVFRRFRFMPRFRKNAEKDGKLYAFPILIAPPAPSLLRCPF